jgi:uncharacterized protein
MRYLLIFFVVLLVAWFWRTSRISPERKAQTKQSAAPTTLAMVRCTQCGVHLPANDAVKGIKGTYSSADHLHRAEP